MITNKLARILAGCYLLLAVSVVVYELSIRIFDRGNSEFAGMLSVVLTFPASLILIGIGKAFGVILYRRTRIGQRVDSNQAAGLSANA